MDIRDKIEKKELALPGEIEIKPDFNDYDNLYFPSDDADLIGLFKTSQHILNIAKNIVPVVPVLLTINNYPILYENSICLVQGLKSTGKSRTIELIQSAIISKENDGDIIRNEDYEYQLIHIDTERSQKNDFPRSIQTVKHRSGFKNTDVVLNYMPISFIEVKRERRQEVLKLLIEGYINKNPKSQTIVIIDVIQDFISDLLDVKESSLIADYLNYLINHYNVSIVCVIHENLSQIGSKNEHRKATGHLGSKLTEKASSVWQTVRDGEVFSLTCIYSRNFKPMPKDEIIKLSWDVELNGLKMIPIITDPDEKAKIEQEQQEKLNKDFQAEVVSLLKSYGGITQTAFVKEIRNKLNSNGRKLSENEVKNLILKYKGQKTPILDTYILIATTKEGSNHIKYKLELIDGRADFNE